MTQATAAPGRIKAVLIPTIVLFAICAVITLALAGTNFMTAQTIALRQAQAEQEAMARVLPAQSYAPVEATVEDKTYAGYRAVTSDGVQGFLFTVSANGYGGPVKVMTGIFADGTVAAVEVLSADSETPGLGQNALRPSFAGQFAGLRGTLRAGTATQPGDIEAITGATITSNAVTQAVNTALACAAQCMEEGEGLGQ